MNKDKRKFIAVKKATHKRLFKLVFKLQQKQEKIVTIDAAINHLFKKAGIK